MAVTFDANQHTPKQTGSKHPPGNKFPATITATEVKAVRDGGGKKYYELTFTTPAGSIKNNYNLWNDSKQAVEIAVGQLSAVCHATGIFKVNFDDALTEGPNGKELINGKCLIDVGFQAGQEPSAEKPEGGYVEVKKIYDMSGNEPGNKSAPQQQTNQQQNWGNAQPQQQQPAVQQGWGGGNQQQQPQQQNNPATGGWQQGSGTEQPPWTQNK